jgi:phosphatidylserine decarboxylase
MKIHREGNTILTVTLLVLAVLNFGIFFFFDEGPRFPKFAVLGVSVIIFLLFLQFFRYPSRNYSFNENYAIAPCDGKVVAIEQVSENEYFKDKRIQVSIFMSPVNVHINWYPISGRVKYLRYHKGKYLVAWHPKSSTENERTTIVIQKENKIEVLVRQIAGALAKRIVVYPHEGDMVKQCAQLGFIKFGSRVDVLLPLSAKVLVKINDKTTGGMTVLADFT